MERELSDRDRRRAASLRIRRKQLGMSQQKIADRVGIGAERVSRWEAGEYLDTELIQEAYGYYSLSVVDGERDRYPTCSNDAVVGESLAVGLEEPASGKARVLVRVGDASLHRARLEPMLVKIRSGKATGDAPESHLGEEFIFVIAGEPVLELRGADGKVTRHPLGVGSYAHINSESEHRICNRGAEACELLVIKTPPDRYTECTLDQSSPGQDEQRPR